MSLVSRQAVTEQPVGRAEQFLSQVLGIPTSKCWVYFINNESDAQEVEQHFCKHVHDYIRANPSAAAAWAAWTGGDDAAAIDLAQEAAFNPVWSKP